MNPNGREARDESGFKLAFPMRSLATDHHSRQHDGSAASRGFWLDDLAARPDRMKALPNRVEFFAEYWELGILAFLMASKRRFRSPNNGGINEWGNVLHDEPPA